MPRRFGEIVGRVAVALAIFGCAGPAFAATPPADEMGTLFRQILANPADVGANLA